MAPAKPSENTFEQLTELLNSPPPSEVMQRFRFNTRVRKPGESLATYVAELRRLAEFCNFEAILDKMIRDRLVSGINDNIATKELIIRASLNIRESNRDSPGSRGGREIFERAESSQTRTRRWGQFTNKPEPVHEITWQSRKPSNCYCCGTPGHKAAECRHKDKVCHLCNKKGHLAKMCKAQSSGTRKPQKTRHKQIWLVEDELSGDSEDSLGKIQAVKQSGGKLPPLKVCIQVDECKILMEIDMGASISIMS